jgi:diguanylate cyclase (GGDEF)-like protein
MKKFTDMVRQASSEDEVYDILFEMLKKDSNISQIVIMRKEYNDSKLSIYKALDNERLNAIKDAAVNAENCWAIKTGKGFIYNSTNDDFSCRDFYSNAESYACLPIILGGNVSGVIQFQSDMEKYFTNDIVSSIKIYIDTITPVISNLRLLNSLNDLASMDALTKVYNRRYLTKYLDEQINASKEGGHHMCVVMVDIDFFKKFNDTYGHDAGDYVLIHFAEILKSNIREKDVIARYGGEEFVIVLPHTDLPGAYKTAEKLRKKVEDMSLAAINSEAPPKINCSMGISCYPLHGNNMDTLLQSADKALYEAKNSGRNRTCIFGEEKQRKIVRKK